MGSTEGLVGRGGRGANQGDPREDTGRGSQRSFQAPGTLDKAKGKLR